ncbi:hypothetical protein GCM10027270_28180 [Nocardioides ginkgobilobae]|uniref:Unannotated protein n=1 Tax=freshwater metagenome TaxID=449393 RepID=A0A6J6TDS7_9ZZZZ|nr:hypothetical protein [Actinomycetota bacterium]
MENITRQTTAQTPSRFGMPACGHRWTQVQGSLLEGAAVPAVVRDRGAKTGVFAIYIPGDNAWRPPTC